MNRYFRTTPRTELNVEKLVTLHDYEYGPDFSFEGESHDFWELVYVERGSVEIGRDGESHVLSEGEAILHMPNEFHTVRSYNSSPRFFVISFVSDAPAMSALERLIHKTSADERRLLLSIISEAKSCYVIPKNSPTLSRLKRRGDAELGSEQLIKNYLEQLLIMFIRDLKRRGALPDAVSDVKNEALVGAIKEYLDAHITGVIRIDDVCRAFGYCRSYISRIFKSTVGEGVASYVAGRKISLAKEMLRDGKMNVSEVSRALSFDNPQYFSRAFRRAVGMTPSEYKSEAEQSSR